MALAVLMMCGAPAWAAEDGLQGFQLHWDNDAFQRSNTDRWYTNGLRASWSGDSNTTSAMARTAKELSRQWMGAARRKPACTSTSPAQRRLRAGINS